MNTLLIGVKINLANTTKDNILAYTPASYHSDPNTKENKKGPKNNKAKRGINPNITNLLNNFSDNSFIL